MASSPSAQKAKKSPVPRPSSPLDGEPKQSQEGSSVAVVVVVVPREMNHDGTHSLTQSCTSIMMQSQRFLDWMPRSIVVVPGGCNVVPTICYGIGGEDGWMATNAVRRRQGLLLDGVDRRVLFCYGGVSEASSQHTDQRRGQLHAGGTAAVKTGPQEDGKVSHLQTGTHPTAEDGLNVHWVYQLSSKGSEKVTHLKSESAPTPQGGASIGMTRRGKIPLRPTATEPTRDKSQT
ncbi:hypothetical protein EYF80_009294 [Liparis tanakae]|uniref:Uncharacterized protein n=1 Tax=Liparis tanakae TaxID=230148 RepID=A0A4Z2ISR8_9TELE|nr:hypothetical protein EYF80_009294 [Liparis tanakae]